MNQNNDVKEKKEYPKKDDTSILKINTQHNILEGYQDISKNENEKKEKINYNDENNFEITGKVTGQEIYRTHIYIEDAEIADVTCECIDYQNRYAACKHIVATMMEFATNSKYEEMLKSKDSIDVNKMLRTDSKYRSFKQIVNELYAVEEAAAE